MKGREILVIDGDEKTVQSIKAAMQPLGFKVTARARLSSGLKAVNGGSQIVLVGNSLPDSTMPGAVRDIMLYHPGSVIMAMVPRGGQPEARAALAEGARRCLTKPLHPAELTVSVNMANELIALKEEVQGLKAAALKKPVFITKSKAMLSLIAKVDRLSRKTSNLLISGEEGTGRELVARTLHLKGEYRTSPFVSSNGNTLLVPGNNGKGAGSPVSFNRETVQEILKAQSGTLFVKDIGLLEPLLQTSLLVGMAETLFDRGEGKIKQPGIRLMAAVRKNPGLDWPEITIPPLRKRREDILPLARHFLHEAEVLFEGQEKTFSKDAEAFLLRYDWPGNAKELKGAVRKVYVTSRQQAIKKRDFLLEGGSTVKEFLEDKLGRYLGKMSSTGVSSINDDVVSEVQKALIELALKETGGNQLHVAHMLGLSRNTVRSRIREYKIKSPSKKVPL